METGLEDQRSGVPCRTCAKVLVVTQKETGEGLMVILLGSQRQGKDRSFAFAGSLPT